VANGNYGGGNGTEDKPYLVEDAADLDRVRNNLNAHYKQTKTIDLTDWGNWNSIGGFELFKGSYDGQNFKILNLVSFGYYSGLFSRVSEANLKNIELVNVHISNGQYQSGALAGTAGYSKITNCHSGGLIRAESQSGGLIGYAYNCEIEKCHSDCDLEVSSRYTVYQIGGLVGTSSKNRYIDCYATGNIENSGAFYSYAIGGLFGQHTGFVENCYASGNVIGNSQIGGIAGNIYDAEIINSYALNAEIYDSKYYNYNDPIGDIYGNSNPYGNGDEDGNSIINCYSIDTMSSNIGILKVAAVVSLKNAKTRAHYENNGWDFEEVWNIVEGESYPFLRKPITVSQTQCERMPMGGFLRI